MHSSIFTFFGLLASAVSAVRHAKSRRNEDHQSVIYWGQNGGNVVENNDLASYCDSDSGVDLIVLAFLYGGAIGAYGLSSQWEAETIGSNLWAAYGNSGYSGVPRPFGDSHVDGWDFDLEAWSGNQYYQYMISTLRSKLSQDSGHKYYITGAPQCPIPEPYMQPLITSSQFDYLWIQLYNNPYCSMPNPNFNEWIQNVANTPSSSAKTFLGVPAASDGATGTASGSRYYASPDTLAQVVRQYQDNGAFGGIMMWSAGFSDSNRNNGCTYAQEAKHILNTGWPC